MSHSLQFLVFTMAGWLNRQQQDLISVGSPAGGGGLLKIMEEMRVSIGADEQLLGGHPVESIVDLHRGQVLGVVPQHLLRPEILRIEAAFPLFVREPACADVEVHGAAGDSSILPQQLRLSATPPPALRSPSQISELEAEPGADPAFLMGHTPDVLAGLVFAAVLAAIMSSADSFVNIGSAALVRELPRAMGRPVQNELGSAPCRISPQWSIRPSVRGRI